MKNYAHFLILSTGYIEGTIPPQFSDENRKPIEKLGSDSRMWLDGRKSTQSMIIDAGKELIKRRGNIVGFNIYRNGKLVREVLTYDKNQINK